MSYKIELTLKSDTTFGRGDGVAGLVDTEVEHDEFGLPFLRGRALKGLLAEECANILFSLEKFNKKVDWLTSAQSLFGIGGSGLRTNAEMHVGDAVLPDDLRDAVRYAIGGKDENSRNLPENERLTVEQIKNSLTAIRRQTAIGECGAPKENSLRSMRVVVREIVFEAELDFTKDYAEDTAEIILLGVCCRALQRAGLGRNRGRGKIEVNLRDKDFTDGCITNFEGKI